MGSRTKENHPPFEKWAKEQQLPTFSDAQVKKLDEIIKSRIQSELELVQGMSAKENTLFHKYHEIQEWSKTKNQGQVDWVKRLIWKPTGKSDFRRIEPELIFVENEIEIPAKDFFGKDKTEVLDDDDHYLKHWQILRTLVSRARNDGFPGRLMRFLVRDKRTKTYLGVISISSDMLDLTERNKAIGADISKCAKDGGSINCTANGQTIVPTQPFGNAYLGVKLLALLCLSKDVADAWKERYGDTLVGVTTTSLYGESGSKGLTAYDGLTPFWKKMGSSRGDAPIKMTDALYEDVKLWAKHCRPEKYYRFFVKGMRDAKTQFHRYVYRELEFESALKSGFERNVYFSRLYKNTDKYIQNEVAHFYDPSVKQLSDDELVPAFDNSIEALTEHWRFGHATDTRKVLPAIGKNYGVKKDPLTGRDNLRRLVKGRIDDPKRTGLIPTSGKGVDWYEGMGSMTWEQARMQFLDSNED